MSLRQLHLVSWLFNYGTLTMALNPSDQPGDLTRSIDNTPVCTGEFS